MNIKTNEYQKNLLLFAAIVAALIVGALFGYQQGQYNLYVRGCVWEGGYVSLDKTPCTFDGRVNNAAVLRMNMFCDNPARAYYLEGPLRWRHYCK